MIRPRLSPVVGLALSMLGACSDRAEEPARVDLGEAHYAATQAVRFTPAGFLSSPRYRHTATVLLDGRVLVAGGATQEAETLGMGRAPEVTVELFDVMTGKFARVGDLAQARWGHSATLLRDGRVLLVGGYDEQGKPLDSTELFAPDRARLSLSSPLHYARGLHTATLLADGNVLILGGSEDPLAGHAVADAELFDTALGKFERLGQAPNAGFPHAAALMDDGKVVSVWSHESEMRLSVFDPRDRTFFADLAGLDCRGLIAPEPAGKAPECFDVTAFRDHQNDATLNICTTDLIYPFNYLGLLLDRQPSPWSFFPGKQVGDDTKLGASYAIASSDEQLVALGGRPRMGAGSASQPPPVPPLLLDLTGSERLWPTATTLPNGEILVTGGFSDSLQGSSELRSAPSRTQPLQRLPPATSDGHAESLLPDGRVLLTGGYDGNTQVRTWEDGSAEAKSTEGSGLLAERAKHHSLLLASGAVLIAGGETKPATAPEELFDPKSGKSRALDFRLRARGSALRVSDRHLLFAGSTGLEKVDVGTWSVRPIQVELGCPAPGLVRLASGHVIVSGDEVLFELDPATEVLTPLRPYRSPGCDAALGALPDGWILIAGGREASGEASTFALRFDPRTGESIVLPELPEAWLGGEVAVRLGHLLLFGSSGDDASSTSHVLFDWRFDTFAAVPHKYAYSNKNPAVTLLADSSLLVAGSAFASKLSGAVGQLLAPRDAQPLLEVKPGEEIELTATQFSTTWPEDSGGTTASSSTNSPIPVWFPASGGWPALGTFVDWSDDRATWRVPSTAFPGFGVLTYVRSGVTYPLRMVRILEQENGGACDTGGACASGQCVDGMCCDRACAGACESCLAKVKGTGVDGICGGAAAGRVDDRCELESVRSCGQNGLCDGTGVCALYADGVECRTGSHCLQGSCEPDAPIEPLVTRCDGDHTLVGAGEPFDCRAFRCSLASAQCLETCASNADCSDGFACNSKGACQKSPAIGSTEIGCTPGCSATRSNPGATQLTLGLLALTLFRRRQRNARALQSRL